MTSASTSSSESPDVTVSPPFSELDRLGQRPSPPPESCWLHGDPPGPGHVHILTEAAALAEIVAHGESNLHAELGGALLGTAFRDGETLFVEIAAALAARSDNHGPIHFTFTADVWAQLNRDRVERYPELEIVGWFHTHPNLGVFYSGDDVVVHTAAFTLPWHVGLVIDPMRNEAGFFGWIDGKLAPIPGFYEKRGNNDESTVAWRMARTTVWHAGQSYTPDDSYQEPGFFTSAATAVSRQAFIGTAAGVLGLLLGFFLLVGWAIPQNQQIDRLEQVALSLADETGRNAAVCPNPELRILTPANGQTIRLGAEVAIIGTAVQPDAVRYRIETRPVGGETWALVNAQRQDKSLGTLAKWDTTGLPTSEYELRLTAVDRNNIILNHAAICQIALTLTP